MILKCAIVDDEPLAVELLASYVNKIPFMQLAGKYYSATEAMKYIAGGSVDVIFLDIQMPEINGLELSKMVPETTRIVFTTAFDQYALDGFRSNALDYLLKPITPRLLFPLLDRLALREQWPQEGLTLKTGSMLVRVPFSQLAYVEVNGKHLYFNLTDGQVREVVGSLKDYEPLLLARPEFMRIHRSYIVNMLQIDELSPAGVHTFSGANLPVSRLLYPQLQKDYMKLLFAEREEL